MRITMLGMAAPVGGAMVERGHTCLLWKKLGWFVKIIATGAEPTSNPWIERLRMAGCEIELDPGAIGSLRDELCVTICSQGGLAAWPALRQRGCRLIYSPAMNHSVYGDFNLFQHCPPTALHFQSRFQANRLARAYYDKLGFPQDRRFIIPGAFEIDDFPFRPAARTGPFVVGKLARPCRTKWPSNLWAMLSELRRLAPAEALCMAWNKDVEVRLGKPPHWARCLPPDAITSQAFLGQCHALLCLNGGDLENNPRVGMEAMASGVPVVADCRGGWPDMIEPGVSGFLVNPGQDAVARLADLARDEPLRQQVADNGRATVKRLSDPTLIGPLWAQALDAF